MPRAQTPHQKRKLPTTTAAATSIAKKRRPLIAAGAGAGLLHQFDVRACNYHDGEFSSTTIVDSSGQRRQPRCTCSSLLLLRLQSQPVLAPLTQKKEAAEHKCNAPGAELVFAACSSAPASRLLLCR